MQVVIVNGVARSGKDSFCSMCGDFANCYTYSSVQRIKTIARMCGWDGQKTERARKFLSDLKDLTTEFSDLPMKSMRQSVAKGEKRENEILFLMIREPEEIKRAAEEFDALTLLIKRPSIEQITSNHADRNVDNYDYNYTIYNNGSLDDFRGQACDFVEKIKSGYFYEGYHETCD